MLVLVGALMVGSIESAIARPLVNFVDEGTFSYQIGDCENLVLDVEGAFWEHILISARGRDGLPHFQANVSVTEVITNPDTGKTFTIASRFVDKDQTVTENEDGTFTAIITFAGRIQYRGPDGKPLFVEAGQIVSETVWDDDGDFPTGGTRLELEELKVVGVSQVAGRDFCDDMHEFLG